MELTEILLSVMVAMMPIFLVIALANWKRIKKMAKDSDNPYDDIVIMGVEKLAERIVENAREEEAKKAE